MILQTISSKNFVSNIIMSLSNNFSWGAFTDLLGLSSSIAVQFIQDSNREFFKITLQIIPEFFSNTSDFRKYNKKYLRKMPRVFSKGSSWGVSRESTRTFSRYYWRNPWKKSELIWYNPAGFSGGILWKTLSRNHKDTLVEMFGITVVVFRGVKK